MGETSDLSGVKHLIKILHISLIKESVKGVAAVQAVLSVCLIVKNEEKYLSRCLMSIKDIASEIIIVDTGSSDHSMIIANQFTNRVYAYEWQNNFSSARNFCLEKTKGEWILILDGDEELDNKSRDLLQEKMLVADMEAYLLTVKNHYKKAHELMDIPNLQLRLFRNNKKYRYRGVFHEQILDSILDDNPSARIEIAPDINITHYGYTEGENEKRLERNTNMLKQVYELEEHEKLRHFYLGSEYYRHQKFAEALEYFLFVYKRGDPQLAYYPELLRSISICLYMLDKVPTALSFIDGALGAFNDMGDLYYLQGYFYKAQGYYSEAYEAFQKSLINLPQPFCYANIYCQHQYKTHFYLGGLAEYFMDKDMALFNYFESLKKNPYVLDSLRRMVAILNPKINPEYTIHSLNKIFDLSDTGLRIELAIIFYEEGAYNLVLDCIQQLEESGPLVEKAKLLKGLALLRNKQYSEAEAELLLINNHKNLHIKAQQYLLLYYWLIQDKQKASGCLHRISNTGAEPVVIYVLNLLIGGKVKRNINAVPGLEYALAKDLMDLLIELGDRHRVNEAFQNLVPVLGGRPSYLLAEILYKYKKYELAEEEFRCLLETNHTGARVFYYLGKICWARGDLNGAEQYLHDAIVNGLDIPKIHMETVRLHQEQAIASLKKGSKLCPVSLNRSALIEELENCMIEI